jgi:hypothetical protein
MITYYYNEDYKTLKKQRSEREKELVNENKDNPYPTYDRLNEETYEDERQLVFTIRDSEGKVVKKEFVTPKKGLQRWYWDLRYTLPDPVTFEEPSFYNPFSSRDEGTLVLPGSFSVEMHELQDGKLTALAGPVSFNVKALDNAVLPAKNRSEKVAFQKDLAALLAQGRICDALISDTEDKLKHIKKALKRAELAVGTYEQTVAGIEKQLRLIKQQLYGDPVKRRLDIDQPQNPMFRLGVISNEQKYSTATPTQTHRDSYAIAKKQIDSAKDKLEELYNVKVKQLEEALLQAGVPYTPGRGAEFRD